MISGNDPAMVPHLSILSLTSTENLVLSSQSEQFHMWLNHYTMLETINLSAGVYSIAACVSTDCCVMVNWSIS